MLELQQSAKDFMEIMISDAPNDLSLKCMLSHIILATFVGGQVTAKDVMRLHEIYMDIREHSQEHWLLTYRDLISELKEGEFGKEFIDTIALIERDLSALSH